MGILFEGQVEMSFLLFSSSPCSLFFFIETLPIRIPRTAVCKMWSEEPWTSQRPFQGVTAKAIVGKTAGAFT